MNRKLPIALLAGLLGIATVLLENVSVLALTHDVDLSGQNFSWLVVSARFASFVLVFVVLLALAYWAGRSLDLRAEYPTLLALPVLLGTVGAGAAYWYILGLSGTDPYDLLTAIVLTLGRSFATGLELGVVVLAGTALGHFSVRR